MPFTVCPFCGIATETLHDTQAACIDALRAEIARAQTLLTRSQPVPAIRCPLPDRDPGSETETP